MRVLAICLFVAACGGPTGDPGADQLITVRGAVFYREPPPAPSTGPGVTTASFIRSVVQPGTAAGLSGLVPAGTGAIIVDAKGDDGYWVLTPGVADPVLPDQLSFASGVTLAARATEPIDVELRAVALGGLVGPITTLGLAPEPREVPAGHVVVSLDWDVEADLDLRVVDSLGNEVWNKKINSYSMPAPGEPVGPNDYERGGILDFDSNASCAIDGRRQENVVWATTAPAGIYTVRVDAFSLCTETAARWRLRALVDGAVVAEAHGTMLPSDTRFPHGPGAGLFATTFAVPEPTQGGS